MGTGQKVLVALIENGDVEQHSYEINRLLSTATHFICVVAFAKFSGWALIKQVLTKRAAKGLKATFVIGLNFYQSDPKVLRDIRRLQSKAAAAGGDINLYIGDLQSQNTLHPKAYWFKGPDGEALIVGSANMTRGGLVSNHELSAWLSGPSAKYQAWLDDWITSRIENEEIVEATLDRIRAYEKRRNIYQATMKTAQQRASRAMKLNTVDTLTLRDLLVEMRADQSSQGFEHSVARRRANLPKARAQLAVLTRQPDIAQAAFLSAYEVLISHWHSSGIERGKTIGRL